MLSLAGLLEKCSKEFSGIPGLIAIYGVDLEAMKLTRRGKGTAQEDQALLEVLVGLVRLLRDDSLQMLLIEKRERIFIRRIDAGTLLVFVADKNVPIGNLFTLIRKLDY